MTKTRAFDMPKNPKLKVIRTEFPYVGSDRPKYYTVEANVYQDAGFVWGGHKTLAVYDTYEKDEAFKFAEEAMDPKTFRKLCEESDYIPEIEIFAWPSATEKVCVLHLDTLLVEDSSEAPRENG